MSPSHASKEIRQQQILQAAITCFSRKGYHLTTMDDIVTESGLSKGSLYWHFKNKKDVFLSTMKWYFSQVETEFETIISTVSTSTEQLHTLADSMSQLLKNPEAEPLVSVLTDFYAETRHDPEAMDIMKQILQTFIHFITTVVDKGIEDGTFKTVNAQQIAVALMATFDGIYIYSSIFQGDFDWPQVVHTFMQTFVAGLSITKS